jgi:hypothetical protein
VSKAKIASPSAPAAAATIGRVPIAGEDAPRGM